ncbi:hypothetical protein H4582DRAFT_378002 [Lactarius indigo]|nr:hypothetical protein H4582DRAFT_378002 [Lactarius indigo]
MTDSEVEPDLDFNSSKARKKISVSSAKSAQSAISSFSTASESTTTSATSVATTSTAATTVSPSISTHTSVDKTGSQVPIADEDGTIVSVEMHLPQTGISATDWAEFRRFCDAHHDTSLRLAGSTQGAGIADILVVEVKYSGKVRGVELLLYPRHPSPCTNADFIRRIPGSCPLSGLPTIPCVSPIDIPQSACNECIGGALALEGTRHSMVVLKSRV